MPERQPRLYEYTVTAAHGDHIYPPKTVTAAYYVLNEQLVEFKDADHAVVYAVPLNRLILIERGQRHGQDEARARVHPHFSAPGYPTTATAAGTTTVIYHNTPGDTPPAAAVPAAPRPR